MNDEVGISPYGRSEMGVFVEAKSEMAERFGGVAGLLERTEHEVGDDAFLRFADNFANQPLIMLRRDTQLAAGKRHLHAALAAVPVGVGASRFRGHRDATMANRDLALMQVRDTQGVAESASQFFELENFAGVGLLMNAMERFDAAVKKIRVDGAIGRQHELFNQTLRDVALAARDIGHALRFVELDDWFGKIEIDRAVLVAAGVEEQSEFLHVAEARSERGVTLGHLRVAFDDFVDVGVSHAFGRTNNAGSHA